MQSIISLTKRKYAYVQKSQNSVAIGVSYLKERARKKTVSVFFYIANYL